MALLDRVTRACGPSICRREAETVAGLDGDELGRARCDVLIGRLGLPDERPMGGIRKAPATLGRDNRHRDRPLLHSLPLEPFDARDALG